jgi:hypothetical protein
MENQPKLLPEKSLISSSEMKEIRMRYLQGNLEWECYLEIEENRTIQFGSKDRFSQPEDTILQVNE